MNRIGSLATLVAVAWLGLAPAASAEFDLDTYLGGSAVDSSRLYLRLGSDSFSGAVDWDRSIAVGLRGTYWFEGKFDWIGLAVDWSYSSAKLEDGDGVEVQMFPISPLLMARIPLFKSERFERGRFAPYAAVGPGIFISRLAGDGSPSDVDVPIGLDYRFGMSFMLRKNLGVFSEYRYTSATFKFNDGGARVKTHLNVNQGLVGLKLRF